MRCSAALATGVAGLLALGCASANPTCRLGLEQASSEPAAFSLFLVGDAGDMAVGDAVYGSLSDDVASAVEDLGEEAVAAVFLGDNLYPHGLEEGDTLQSPRASPLRAQLEASSEARAVFVPGNHDWKHGEPGGWERSEAQKTELRRWARESGSRVEALPESECPDVVARDFGEDLRVIFLDSQWWLEEKSHFPKSCSPLWEEEFAQRLRELVAGAGDRRVLIAAHHPLRSGGTHGGYFSFRQHLFPLVDVWKGLFVPLPLLGSLGQYARRWFTPQDLRSARYRHFVSSVEGALSGHEVLAWAAGHDHNLQIITGAEPVQFHLVSGAGSLSRRSAVHCLRETQFASGRNGYMRLDVTSKGDIRLEVAEIGDDGRAQKRAFKLAG